MDGEVSALVESLRAGAGRLAADLPPVETNMGELYDAAAGRSRRAAAPNTPRRRCPSRSSTRRSRAAPPAAPAAAQPAPQAPAEAPEPACRACTGRGGDLDGARLIALNMALNGESRADTERYLAENFQLPDRHKLIDEVYAAIEG